MQRYSKLHHESEKWKTKTFHRRSDRRMSRRFGLILHSRIPKGSYNINVIQLLRNLPSVFVSYLSVVLQGYLVNWEAQKNVWDYVFGDQCCRVNFKECPAIVTEPYFNFSSIQEGMTEIFFEEYECQSLLRINRKYWLTFSDFFVYVLDIFGCFSYCYHFLDYSLYIFGVIIFLASGFTYSIFSFVAGDLSAYHYSSTHPKTLCCLVVDSGYSFTHIVPYIKGKKYKKAIIRVDVGGKLLTNHLKEVISYR